MKEIFIPKGWIPMQRDRKLHHHRKSYKRAYSCLLEAQKNVLDIRYNMKEIFIPKGWDTDAKGQETTSPSKSYKRVDSYLLVAQKNVLDIRYDMKEILYPRDGVSMQRDRKLHHHQKL